VRHQYYWRRTCISQSSATTRSSPRRSREKFPAFTKTKKTLQILGYTDNYISRGDRQTKKAKQTTSCSLLTRTHVPGGDVQRADPATLRIPLCSPCIASIGCRTFMDTIKAETFSLTIQQSSSMATSCIRPISTSRGHFSKFLCHEAEPDPFLMITRINCPCCPARLARWSGPPCSIWQPATPPYYMGKSLISNPTPSPWQDRKTATWS